MKKRSVQRTIEIGITVIAIIIGIFVIVKYNINDLKQARRAEYTLKNLNRLRIALEEYYQLTKEYPDLTREGVKDDLKLLDYRDKNGVLISFAEIYGRNTIPKTPENELIMSSNEVYDTNNFKEGTGIGGWNYDFSGRTGEIHANLPNNIFSQNLEWNEY